MAKKLKIATSRDIPAGHDVGFYYAKFKRAATDETLERMVEAAQRKLAESSFSDLERKLVKLEIDRAEGRRQMDFDGDGKRGVDVQVVEKRSNMASSKNRNLTPEQKMAEMLSDMHTK
ncbi:hypothetical protein [Vibrio crassostreae]|uniref:hypothetical protein n=1 Tax=Vibrio crassostreae TaxID=246167 RepID=UPI001B30475D|nr:hypothetical protein [Vibrio crassostreae]